MKKILLVSTMMLLAIGLTGCKDDKKVSDDPQTDLPDWYYTGGRLGTTPLSSTFCFQQPTSAVNRMGEAASFDRGDNIAEKVYNTNPDGVRHGLGPVWVRSSCQHCHPTYSHGMSIPEGKYNTTEIGNGTLLVVYDPTKASNPYVSWLAGMPQLHAVAPFKAPLDGTQITVEWLTATDEHSNQFPDGESYELVYPEVHIPISAIYSAQPQFREVLTALPTKSGSDIHNDINLLDGGYEVRLENTIGIYGTGLLDAITDKDIIAQYEKEYADGYLHNGLNPAFFSGGSFQESGYYQNKVQWGPKRFTYALTRGPLQDGAGANAIWNITNVTRGDRTKNYVDLDGRVYATCASIDPEVQANFDAYVRRMHPDSVNSEYAPTKAWFEGEMKDRIYNYLTSQQLPAEMTDEEFTNFMVWHRGLAVPAARNVTDEKVLRGKELFSQIGCDYCHRPTWTTGEDEVRDPNGFFAANDGKLPRYSYQKIWPYTDMIQHKLCMVNDIRTGWCRTTPLWGRGLHRKATGDVSEARLHDTRARNVIEAIMWHGYSQESDAYYPTQKFYNLEKEDRDAIVAFINAI